MAEADSNPKLLFALASALVVALMVIAFLIGRESGRNAARDAEAALPPLPPVPELAPEAAKEAADPWRQRDEEYAYIDLVRGSLEGMEEKPDGTLVLSNTRPDAQDRRASEPAAPAKPSMPAKAETTGADPRSAVADYFQRIDVIRSSDGAGDPNTFAMNMIKAGMGGATSGFDRLIADTDRMAAELQSVTPPPSCQGYHQASLEALVQTRDLIDGMKVAIVAHDVRALGAVAQEAAALQNQAEALKALEKAIRASAQ